MLVWLARGLLVAIGVLLVLLRLGVLAGLVDSLAWSNGSVWFALYLAASVLLGFLVIYSKTLLARNLTMGLAMATLIVAQFVIKPLQ